VNQLLTSAIVHTIWGIWIERNNIYFSNKLRSMCSIFNTLLAEAKLSFDLKLMHSFSAMQDFKIANLFRLPLKSKRLTPIQEVAWSPPPSGCIIINCVCSSFGNPACGSIGVIFRNSSSTFLGASAQNIGHASPLEAEFSACMFAIEKASDMHLFNICIETDSIIMANAFKSQEGVPWKMQIRWHNCMYFCSQISSSCTHVLCEGNMVADALAKVLRFTLHSGGRITPFCRFFLA